MAITLCIKKKKTQSEKGWKGERRSSWEWMEVLVTVGIAATAIGGEGGKRVGKVDGSVRFERI